MKRSTTACSSGSGVRCGAAGIVGPDRTPGPAGQLAGGRRGAPDDLGDLVERDPEHVVEEERRPLRWRELVEYDAERASYLVVEGDPVGRVGGGVRRPGRQVVRVARRRVAAMCGADPVQGEAADDHDEPGPDVVDLLDALDREPGEGVLDHVLGLGRVREDPRRDRDDIGPVVPPGGGDPLVGVHAGQDDSTHIDVTPHQSRMSCPPSKRLSGPRWPPRSSSATGASPPPARRSRPTSSSRRLTPEARPPGATPAVRGPRRTRGFSRRSRWHSRWPPCPRRFVRT